VTELGYSLWQGDEPEGGTKPFGSMTEKGLVFLFFIFFLLVIFFLVLFFLLLLRSSLFKKNVFVFLRYSSRNWAGTTPLMEGALGWISWGKEGEGKVVMMRREEVVQVFFETHESPEILIWVMVQLIFVV